MSRQNTCIVYCIEHIESGRKYFGYTSCKLNERWLAHLRDSFNPNVKAYEFFIHRAIRKYGVESFSLNVISDGLTPEDAKLLEMRLIAENGTFGAAGFNMTAGGEGSHGVVPSEESRRKLSVALKGRKQSPEWVEKRISGRRGKELSPETRQKIRDKARGRKRTPEQVESQRQKMKGRKFTEEHRAKISAALTGRQFSPEHRANAGDARRGEPLSPEHRRKIGDATRGRRRPRRHATQTELPL